MSGNNNTVTVPAGTVADAYLALLAHRGVDYLFANAGTDFVSIVEGLAKAKTLGRKVPTPITAPHENAAISMAHGYYLVTGRPQSAMVHVHVGLANSAMGIINAASDHVPLIMMSGRTPLTEFDRHGSRMTPIQYGQEVRDQGAMVREFVKWDYEMRFAEQATHLVDRAVAIAMSDPYTTPITLRPMIRPDNSKAASGKNGIANRRNP